MTFRALMGRPGAFLPPLMSLAALTIVVWYVITVGTARQSDEGAAAHAWQLLMVAQLPIAALFTFRWLPEAPAQAIAVLTVQAAAALLALAPVFLLGF